jgi:hypothetical protein
MSAPQGPTIIMSEGGKLPTEPTARQVERLVQEHSGQNTTPLSPRTAEQILADYTPPGGSTHVRGEGGQGADVQVRNSADQIVGNVEVKAVGGYGGFNGELSSAANRPNQNNQVGVGDTLAIQVPNGTDASAFLARYWGTPGRTTDPAILDRLSQTYVVVYDQQGRVLVPRQPIYNPPKKP